MNDFKSTMQFKWFIASLSEEENNPCSELPRQYPEERGTYHVLKQRWVNEVGDEKWELIDVE